MPSKEVYVLVRPGPMIGIQSPSRSLHLITLDAEYVSYFVFGSHVGGHIRPEGRIVPFPAFPRINMIFNSLWTILPILVLSVTAAPSIDATENLEARQAVDNIVYVTDATSFW